MIIKNKYGNIELKFGNAEIGVGRLNYEGKGIVAFNTNTKDKKVGDEEITSDKWYYEYPVYMIFPDKQSIDVLIDALNEIKDGID